MLNKKRFQYIIPIIYAIGACGFFIPGLRNTFIALTPITLLLSAGILIYFHPKINLSFMAACLGIGLLGYFVELLGVHTGFPFGRYEYEHGLGPKVFGVPPMIAVNWFILVYICAYVSRLLLPSAAIITRSLLSAGFMVAFDLIIEPFAIQFSLWEWENEIVPLTNYIAWFVISFVFQLLWNKIIVEKHTNNAAILLFISMALFFGVLLFA